ncbi:MAG: hypothetical protein V8S58_14400 [Lachnospiraceae bacterium]
MLLLCILICAIFGLINGIVIAYLNVPAFISILGMQLAVYGICLVYTNATPLGGYRKAYTAIATGRLFRHLPYMFMIAFLIGLIMWFVFNYTGHGKYMYAISGNEAAALVSGVNVKKTKIIIYVTAAALYAIAASFSAQRPAVQALTWVRVTSEGNRSLHHRRCIRKRWYRPYIPVLSSVFSYSSC